ncbi:hypothetical protein ABZ297_11965 [Nonomuraea sp. NPDC005983]|uniref:hypothetical protein n=1 Tax=Nonomuraea sp. NPDC005983 TaxID=3155595 RepID=UPI0033A4871E
MLKSSVARIAATALLAAGLLATGAAGADAATAQTEEGELILFSPTGEEELVPASPGECVNLDYPLYADRADNQTSDNVVLYMSGDCQRGRTTIPANEMKELKPGFRVMSVHFQPAE